jgi:predicted membrane channel-forming protein YqfA (hemolysin III family)
VLCWVVLYCAVLCCAALPTGFFESPGLWWGVGIVVSLGLGAYVYAVKWPECVYTDAFWSSHSLMHLFVNAAYFCEFGFLVSAYHWHHSPGTERAFDSWLF